MLGSLSSVMADSGLIFLHSQTKAMSRSDWRASGSEFWGLNARDWRKLSNAWFVWSQLLKMMWWRLGSRWRRRITWLVSKMRE